MESILLERHGADLIKELELLYPGPYTVYHYEKFPITERYKLGFKIGATRNLIQRNKQLSSEVRIKLSLPKVLFETNSLLEAAEKEREISLELGIHGNTDYINDLHRQTFSRSRKAHKKTVANTDYAAREAKLNKKLTHSHLQRGVVAISPEGVRTMYSGANEAARQLTKKTGIKFYQGGISNVWNPNRPDVKTYRGYTFEYSGS